MVTLGQRVLVEVTPGRWHPGHFVYRRLFERRAVLNPVSAGNTRIAGAERRLAGDYRYCTSDCRPSGGDGQIKVCAVKVRRLTSNCLPRAPMYPF